MDDERLSLTTISDEHLIPLTILCNRLQTNLKEGILEKNVDKKLQTHGKNKFKCPKRKLSSQMRSKFSTATKNEDEKFTRTEWKKLFGHCIPEETIVIRDGVKKIIPGKNLVEGDLVVLERGDKIPADIRLVYSENLFVDNRLVTGNKVEMRSHLNDYVNQDCLLSGNMVFACTKVLSGIGIGLVLRTGENTVFGTIKNYATKVKFSSTTRKTSLESCNDSDDSQSDVLQNGTASSTLSLDARLNHFDSCDSLVNQNFYENTKL